MSECVCVFVRARLIESVSMCMRVVARVIACVCACVCDNFALIRVKRPTTGVIFLAVASNVYVLVTLIGV